MSKYYKISIHYNDNETRLTTLLSHNKPYETFAQELIEQKGMIVYRDKALATATIVRLDFIEEISLPYIGRFSWDNDIQYCL